MGGVNKMHKFCLFIWCVGAGVLLYVCAEAREHSSGPFQPFIFLVTGLLSGLGLTKQARSLAVPPL